MAVSCAQSPFLKLHAIDRALVLIDPPYDLCFTDNFNFRLQGAECRATSDGRSLNGLPANEQLPRFLLWLRLGELRDHWPSACVVIW